MPPEEILAQLDRSAEQFTFPALDNGYIYPADARLSIYRNTQDWLMIIEHLGAYTPRVCGYDTFQNCLHIYGSDLHRPAGTASEDFLYPIEACPDDPLFPDEYEWFVKNNPRCVMVRGNRIKLDLSPAALTAKGIVLLDPPQIDPVAVLRSLLPEHREQLLASELELDQRNKHKLPLFLRLAEWHHPDVTGDATPSASETFQMLAAAISSGNTQHYRPTKPPNTHWRNWPEGGTL